MKTFYPRLKLNWFDGCCRAGVFILTTALVLAILYALSETFRGWTFLLLFAALYLYVRPKNRGIEYARTIKHNGYRFKVWQGYCGRWYWQSVDWPFLEQRSFASEYECKNGAMETIDFYLSSNWLPRRDEPPSASELKKQRTYKNFCNWVEESKLEWSPSVTALRNELNYWRDGDDRLLKEATAYYENRKRMRELETENL
jgi:hypothetical protein